MRKVNEKAGLVQGVGVVRGRLGGGAVGLEDGEDFGFGDVEAEGFHGDFELMVVDFLVFVQVEKVELSHFISSDPTILPRARK